MPRFFLKTPSFEVSDRPKFDPLQAFFVGLLWVENLCHVQGAEGSEGSEDKRREYFASAKGDPFEFKHLIT